jgi:hypothetical protein
MLKTWYLLFNPSFSLERTKNIYHDWNAGGRMLTNLSWKNNIVNFVCLITLLVVQTLNRPEKAEHLADRQRSVVETSACFSSLEKANLNKTICLFTITRIDSSDKYLVIMLEGVCRCTPTWVHILETSTINKKHKLYSQIKENITVQNCQIKFQLWKIAPINFFIKYKVIRKGQRPHDNRQVGARIWTFGHLLQLVDLYS